MAESSKKPTTARKTKKAAKAPATKKKAAGAPKKAVKKPKLTTDGRHPVTKELPIPRLRKKEQFYEHVPDWRDHDLNTEELKFVGYYIMTDKINGHHNGTEAVILTRAKGKISRASAGVRATELLKRPNVQAAIAAFKDRWFDDLRQQCREKAMKRLAAQAFFDIGDILDGHGRLKYRKTVWENEEECKQNLKAIAEAEVLKKQDPDEYGDLFIPYIEPRFVEIPDLDAMPPELRIVIKQIKTKLSSGLSTTEYTLGDDKEALRMLQDYIGLFETEKGGDANRMTDETRQTLNDIFAEPENPEA